MYETMSQMSELIIQKLLQNPKVPRDITGESRIVEDLAFDSLAVMNFVMELEDELNVSLPLDYLADVRTINDLAECLLKLQADKE
ncbi:acyl carrier protein [Acetobacteraceae bacterium]|nr:acyl carrier protein [Acetobacteraceae bacterium]